MVDHDVVEFSFCVALCCVVLAVCVHIINISALELPACVALEIHSMRICSEGGVGIDG